MCKSSKAAKIAAAIVITVNFITVVLSLMAFAIALWMIVSAKSLAYVIQVTSNSVLKALLPEDSLTLQLGIGLSLLSIFFLFVSFMGLYGAIHSSPFLLFMYATLILLLMLLESALFFYFTSNIVEKGVEETDGNLAHAFRLALKCCDYTNDSVTDAVRKIPWSCCTESNCTQSKLNTLNCKDSMKNWLQSYGKVVYGCIIATHVLFASCSLLRRVSYLSHSYS